VIDQRRFGEKALSSRSLKNQNHEPRKVLMKTISPSSARPIIAFAVLALASAGFVVSNPRSRHQPETVVPPGPENEVRSSPPQPNKGMIAVSRSSSRETAEWKRHLSHSLAIAAFVLNGPLPTKPLQCLWYYYRFIPVWPYFDGNQDDRARRLIFHDEDLKHVPKIWEKAWATDAPDIVTPYRTIDGGIR